MNAVTQLTRSQLPALLAALGGGFFAGVINIDGQEHALAVSPKAEGDLNRTKWGAYGKEIEGADSFFNGLANTDAMAAAGSDVAQKVRALRIGGHDDWHIPSRDQLELLYRHCKPTSEENWKYRNGDNPSSVPPGYPYTEQLPTQCANTLFQEGGAEAFDDVTYWSSTQYSAHRAWFQGFGDGSQGNHFKDDGARVRAVRTIPLGN